MSKNSLKNGEGNLKICSICKLSIDVTREHHLILEEKRGKEEITKSYYHANCFRGKFLVQQQMKDTLNQLRSFVNKSVGGVSL